jgi:hypothetical protein
MLEAELYGFLLLRKTLRVSLYPNLDTILNVLIICGLYYQLIQRYRSFLSVSRLEGLSIKELY